MFDESFWLALCFFIFLYFVYKPIRNAIMNGLDSRVNDIKAKVEEAARLKLEAESLLDEIKKEISNFPIVQEDEMKASKANLEKIIQDKQNLQEIKLERLKQEALSMIEERKLEAKKEIELEIRKEISTTLEKYFTQESRGKNYVSDHEIMKRISQEN